MKKHRKALLIIIASLLAAAILERDGKVSVLLSGEREDILSEMPKILSVYDVQ